MDAAAVDFGRRFHISVDDSADQQVRIVHLEFIIAWNNLNRSIACLLFFPSTFFLSFLLINIHGMLTLTTNIQYEDDNDSMHSSLSDTMTPHNGSSGIVMCECHYENSLVK